MSGSEIAASLGGMEIPSLEDSIVGRQRGNAVRRKGARVESDSKRDARRGRRRCCQSCDSQGKGGCNFADGKGDRNGDGLSRVLNPGGCDGGRLLLRGAT